MKVFSPNHLHDDGSVSQFLADRLRIASFSFDGNNCLLSWQGTVEDYLDASQLQVDTDGAELFSFLVGLDLNQTKDLPYMELSNGSVVDAYVMPTSAGYELIIVDASLKRTKHQQVQQIANVTSLQNDSLEGENEELSAENEAKSKFISTFSHELKTPLASILGYAELLSEQAKQAGDSGTHVEAIHRNGIYLLNLINNVLEQGRADIQQTTITTSPVLLSELIKNMTYLVEPLATKKKLQFSTHFGCDEDLVLVLDEQHLIQVLVNLVTNAIKFSEEGYITIEVSYAERELQFVVADTGIGIPDDELLNIMQPFGRAKHTRHIEGAGIGLSLSNQLVTLMGGELSIQSQLGEGTIVTVTLPTTEAVLASDLKRDAEVTDKQKVLLAEDDADLLPLYGYFLEEAGYDVLTAMSKSELLEVMQEHDPALILMDHNFREANGIDLTKQLLDDGYAGKVIMLTASSGEAIIKQAKAAGCVDFLAKPVDREQLLTRLNEHLA